MQNPPQASRPIRVLHVIDSLGPAGAEHQLVSLVSHLRRHRVASEVAVLQQPYTLKPLLDGLGVTVHTMDHSNGKNFFATAYRLSGLLRKRDFDIVHAHLWNSIVAVGLSKLGSSKEKRFLTFHNSSYQQFPARSIVRRIRKIFDRLLLRYSDRSVCRRHTLHCHLEPETAGFATRGNDFQWHRSCWASGFCERGKTGNPATAGLR